MLPANASNEISYKSFCKLGGLQNPTLQKVQRRNGSHEYITYHHIGTGQAFYRNDNKQIKPK